MESSGATFVATLLVIVTGAVCITDPTETRALKAVKNSITDKGNNLNSWESGDPCENFWEGVYCSDKDENGIQNVKKLHLMKLNLSGSLSPEIGSLSHLEVLDFMWNNMSGVIPKEIGKLAKLQLLLLNGNNLTGILPEELGNLISLDRLQIDENHISGSLPTGLQNLNECQHFHMNNNSFSGSIPWQFGRLQNLKHLLFDNNNLTGDLPPQLGNISALRILQLDNNHFGGSIPEAYTNLKNLHKLSLRNCSLKGSVLNFGNMPSLEYLDLSHNELEGRILTVGFPPNITTIDLSYNKLTGEIPESFVESVNLQAFLLKNNMMNGSVAPLLGSKLASQASTTSIVLDFQDNALSEINDEQILGLSTNISVWLYNNPVCKKQKLKAYCTSQNSSLPSDSFDSEESFTECPPSSCVPGQDELIPNLAINGHCICASPVLVEFRLKSPSFYFFPRYKDEFLSYIAEGLSLKPYQTYIESYKWELGPRLHMVVKLFPAEKGPRQFNCFQLQYMFKMLVDGKIKENDVIGPKDIKKFDATLHQTGSCSAVNSSKHMSNEVVIGIVFACMVGTALTVTLLLFWIAQKPNSRVQEFLSSKQCFLKETISKKFKISDVEFFTFEDISMATNNFSEETKIGQGGYGKVYRGLLKNGQIVAIKRASGESLGGDHEFYKEISLLSSVHHRNLVPLIGYCNERDEQILVYEFMENGSLHDHLHKKAGTLGVECLDFKTRVSILLGAAKGILYLHTGVEPPIIHRDIKSSNILLDKKKFAKISDFGMSKQSQEFDAKGNVTNSFSTKVKGTPGYLDPEYYLTLTMTTKSDIYSFGVVILELLTGRQPTIGGKNIVKEVRQTWEAGTIDAWIDARMGWYPPDDVKRMIQLALDCVNLNPDSRPSMAEVVKCLYSISSQYTATDSLDLHDEIPSNTNEINEKKGKSTMEIKLISGFSLSHCGPSIQQEGDETEISNNTQYFIDHLAAR